MSGIDTSKERAKFVEAGSLLILVEAQALI